MSGHGHVTPNPGGLKARCGGPGLCSECASEQAALVLGQGLAPPVLRALVEQATTVIRPGETLLIRVPPEWAPVQAAELQEHAQSCLDYWGVDGIRVLVLPAAELAVIRPGEAAQ